MEEFDQPAERAGVDLVAVVAALGRLEVGAAVAAVAAAVVGMRFFGDGQGLLVAAVAGAGAGLPAFPFSARRLPFPVPDL